MTPISTPICSIFCFLWCKYSHCGQGWGREAHDWFHKAVCSREASSNGPLNFTFPLNTSLNRWLLKNNDLWSIWTPFQKSHLPNKSNPPRHKIKRADAHCLCPSVHFPWVSLQCSGSLLGYKVQTSSGRKHCAGFLKGKDLVIKKINTCKKLV